VLIAASVVSVANACEWCQGSRHVPEMAVAVRSDACIYKHSRSGVDKREKRIKA